MEQNRNDFLALTCKLYMTTLLAWIPLHTGGSYWNLGDAKYQVFQSVSVICLGIWGIMTLGSLLRYKGRNVSRLSGVDVCMLLYSGWVVLSVACSSYQSVAWKGYVDWHMGAWTQLILVLGYFFISRCCESATIPIYLGEAAFTIVVVVGILNRLGMDPLKLYIAFDEKSWEYSHMISTIGNINWFCGYCSVALAFPMVGYLYSKTRGKKILLYVCSVLGLTLLCAQGSAVGPVIAFTGLGICLVAGIRKEQIFQRTLLLGLGICILFPVMGMLITIIGAQSATPVDGDIYAVMLWKGWWLLTLIVAGLYLLHKRGKLHTQRYLAMGMIGIGAILCIGGTAYLIWKTANQAGDWGSGRGGLWKGAWTGFVLGDWKQKLLGAGPDCFAEYIYRIPEAIKWLTMEGYWENATFANAHNEWLNQLINIGLPGMLFYFSIFVAALKRYRGMLLAMVGIGMYLVNSLVGFQQVLNASLLFLLLGICESRYRAYEKQNI